MAIINYTAKQLYGPGIEVTTWAPGINRFTLSNPSSGSSYFIVESKQVNGSYLIKNILGGLKGLINLKESDFVLSQYVIGVPVPPGNSGFTFTVDAGSYGSVYFRSTGDVSASVEDV
ncbi:hypothetical protein N9H39_00610 [Gammaproteobacteria bacterium]|nr:hypothetical protein [Gammaproteobacteria bacterium]